MRARLKADTWDVWQYQPDRARPLWVLNVTQLVDGLLYLSHEEEGRELLEPGEWLVHASPTFSESDEDFRRDYEVVE